LQGVFVKRMKLWYYVSPNGERVGPVEEAKFMEAARAGVVTGETLVWHAGLDEWKSWASVRPAEMPDGAALAAGATLGGDAGPPADADGTVPFEFHGKWEEFFKIWIVNVLLIVATLGIYAAWAKVRTRRYFYGNTRLFGHAFEYLANPKRILIGNLIVAAMFFTYMFSGLLSPMARLALLIGFALLIPWLVVRGLIFNARNTAWRGLRFRFGGSTGEAFKLFVLWPILVGLSLGLLLPYVAKRKREFYINNHAYGKTGFSVTADVGVFYKLYLKTLVFFVPLIAAYAGFVAFAVTMMGQKNPPPEHAGMLMVMVWVQGLRYTRMVCSSWMYGHCYHFLEWHAPW